MPTAADGNSRQGAGSLAETEQHRLEPDRPVHLPIDRNGLVCNEQVFDMDGDYNTQGNAEGRDGPQAQVG